MPPASPLRKGSLPTDKLKARPSSDQDLMKSQIKKKLFNKGSPAVKHLKHSAENVLRNSSVVLQKLSLSRENVSVQEKKSMQSRPLFSEILKKPPSNCIKHAIAKSAVQKYSPKRLSKKPLKLKVRYLYLFFCIVVETFK